MFQQKPHTIVHSVVQRSLLKWWDELRGGRLAPPRSEIDPDRVARCWSDVVLHEVVRQAGKPRYRFRFHGDGILLVDGADYRGRFLDEVLPDTMRASVLAAYDALLALKCPIYTVRPAVDANGTPVSFERLLLPFSSRGEEVDDILVHIQMFCPDGRYERRQLYEASLNYKEYRVQAALVTTAAPVPAKK